MAGNIMKRAARLFGQKPPDFLELCQNKVRSIEDLANGGNLLNLRQCQDLSTKLSKTNESIRQLVSQSGASADHFRPALENLFRYLEKAIVLLKRCGEEDWCAAAVFQIQNENAFREILLDVCLCYHAIYEHAKSTTKDPSVLPEDLRDSSVFGPPTDSDIETDQQDLQTRLENLVDDPSSVELGGHSQPEEVARKQSLAKYLLVKMQCSLEQSQAITLDTSSGILWQKETEPPGTWGNSHFLGAGANEGGVCSTTWLGIACAKKEFHVKEFESIFLKEAGISAHLKHPCIINFICCSNGQGKGDRYIAMELMEMSLFDLIQEQKGHFSLPVVVDIIGQIARGMCYLHDQGVAHRDLKPQNVVVNRMTYPHITEQYFCMKLVDFGTTKMRVEISKSNTMTAVGIGTSMYRAPEVYPNANIARRGKLVWFKADVFSFAMTCAHVLSLNIPFQDTRVAFTSDELYNALMNGKRPNLPIDCPQELVALLKECWNAIPRRRPSFKDICTRLESIRHKVLRGLDAKQLMVSGMDFIKTKVEEQSSFQKVSFDSSNHEEEGENDILEIVSIIPCTFGHALKHLRQTSYESGYFICDICWEEGDGEVYSCEICQFDAHPGCVELKDKVKVFFHHHPLHLLVQNYHNDDPDAICRFCEESLQDSEWVYRCEQCDLNVHAVCTKYPRERKRERTHPHRLNLTQCPPRQSFLCTCCNGEVRGYTWRYTCTLKSCALDLDPLCATISWSPFCIFDSSHRLSLISSQEGFHCGRCGKLGFSWYYHCKHCGVDIHVDCMDDMDEENGDWNGAYENFMIENGSKDDHSKAIVISELLDKLSVSEALEAASSSSRPPPVMTRVQPSILRLSVTERPGLDISNDVELRREIAAETAVRKAKKMAAKEARQKLRAKSLEMLDNLEKIGLDLRSSENMCEDEVLAAMHEKLKRRQNLVKEQIAMPVHSKMCQGPRIGVFYKLEEGRRELLTSLRADMKNVSFALLCEEPGHEHIVDGKTRRFSMPLNEEKAGKLQLLLASGLQVVMRAMSTLAPELTGLESVTIPILETKFPWDLRAIDLEMHNNQSKNLFEDNVEALQRAEESAEWFRSWMENGGRSILETLGLQRVRYKVSSEEGNFPQYRRGTLAWLCTDHVECGIKDGALESYPLKYVNVEDDHQLRNPQCV